MSLLITIIKAPQSAAMSESSRTFDFNGGSMGRGNDNAWVLEDPERFLSSRHCEFSYDNGQFYITDLSTNGTFYNGSANPIGKGTKLPVKDGDTFMLGDYEFSLSLAGGQPLSDPYADNADDMFSASAGSSSGFGQDDLASNPFAGGHVSSSESLYNVSSEETDPLAALDKAQGTTGEIVGGFGSQPDPFAGPTHSDQADPMNQQVSWPNAVPDQNNFGGGIPDDWDDVPQSSTAPAQAVPTPVQPTAAPANQPVVPRPAPAPAQVTAGNEDALARQRVLENANAKIQSELNMLKQQMSTQQGGANTPGSVDATLVNAMGFQNQNLSDADIAQINLLVGEVVREMVSGLMQVLGSRSSIKNEFRMNVTTIQPVENNPLKFSANVDDALENMFIKKGNAYKKPVEAVREGFNGVAEHQVAILAGIRAAFKSVLQRFNPAVLEARFAKQNKGGLIPGSHKAKNWELYLDYYCELAGDIDNSFQFLFGDEFVRAYEDQLQKISIARQSKQSTLDK